MENNRKCWFLSDCLWKLYIKLNIPSFEHSAACDWQHCSVPPGMFHTQESLWSVVRSGTAFMENCTKQTDFSTNQKLVMRGAQVGKWLQWYCYSWQISCVCADNPLNNQGKWRWWWKGPALPFPWISRFKKQKEVFSGGSVSYSCGKASKLLLLWMFFTS